MVNNHHYEDTKIMSDKSVHVLPVLSL